MLEKYMSAHFAGQRRSGFLHLRLDQAVPRLPHQRLAAEFGDPVVERLRRLDVSDDRCAGLTLQHILGIDLQQLVAPYHPALAIDRTNSVTIAVKGHAEIETFLCHQGLQIGQILFLGRVGMVVGKTAIDFGIEQMMLARSALGEHRGQFLDHRSDCAVAAVPADPERAAGEIL